MIREAIAKLVERQDLAEAEASAVMEELMTGAATPGQVGAFLVALRLKGESVDEITGMARVMREKVTPVVVDGPLLDTCSTGGGGFDPFNVSTAAAFVCAGAGARVAKHGNRGFTSASGSADVLEALGAKIDLGPEQVAACIETAGVGFMFAQAFHPAMRFVGPVRREIGIRTTFNFLGPLTNPAGAQHQLLGVGNAELAPKLAEALLRLGTGRSLIVHGADGLDEVSLSAPTSVYDIKDGAISTYSLSPEAAGLKPVALEELRSGTSVQNAERLKAVFTGAQGADRDFVLINAGAGLIAAGRAADLREGVALARQSIDTGAAQRALEAFVATSQSFAGASQ